jgi:hypothetical protein
MIIPLCTKLPFFFILKEDTVNSMGVFTNMETYLKLKL